MKTTIPTYKQSKENRMNHNIINVEPIRGVRCSFDGYKSSAIIHVNLLFIVPLNEFNQLKEEFLQLSKIVETHITTQVITWVSVFDVAQEHMLSPDAIRKRLNNGDFEEGKDFKKVGGRIQVHQGAIGRLQRQRRNNNG